MYNIHNIRKIIFASILVALLFSFFGCTQKADDKSIAQKPIVDINGSQATKTTILTNRDNSIPSNITKITPQTDVYPPKLHSDEWEQPVPLPSAINTAGAEDSPFITPDGNTLYFFFTPDPNIPAEKQLFDGVTGMWVSKKVNGQWAKAERVVLQEQGKLSLDGCQYVNGDKMWFCSAREGYTGVQWFTADYENGKWQDWKYVGGKFVDYEVGELHFSKDGTQLYFHSGRSSGKGGLDIWMSEVKNGELQQPQNIGAVNSADNEGWPFLSDNGKELWFLRTYLGSPALFRSKKVNDTWSKPELIISQFAGEPTLDNQGNLYFVHHYYKNSTMLEADIYYAKKK
jgi:hypothetical protein